MTYMQTVRFLADYIDGDKYFGVHHPESASLQRTRSSYISAVSRGVCRGDGGFAEVVGVLLLRIGVRSALNMGG